MSFDKSWFDSEKVHQIEVQALEQSFQFVGLSFEANYKGFRNYIINLYNTNTERYLSVTSCRRSISLDVALLAKIHNFLEYWGLINTLCKDFKVSTGIVNLEATEPASAFQKTCFKCKASLVSEEFYRDANHESLCRICANSSNNLVYSNANISGLSADFNPDFDVEKLLSCVEENGNDWELIGSKLGISAEDALFTFLKLFGRPEFKQSDLLSSNGNPFQTLDTVSQNIVHLIGANCSSSLASFISKSKHLQNLDAFEINAEKLLSHESLNFILLCQKLTECTLKRLDLKIRYLEDLETSLLREKGIIERHRLQVFMERFNLKKSSMPDVQSRSNFNNNQKELHTL